MIFGQRKVITTSDKAVLNALQSEKVKQELKKLNPTDKQLKPLSAEDSMSLIQTTLVRGIYFSISCIKYDLRLV